MDVEPITQCAWRHAHCGWQGASVFDFDRLGLWMVYAFDLSIEFTHSRFRGNTELEPTPLEIAVCWGHWGQAPLQFQVLVDAWDIQCTELV